jgi:hypothetical protein
MNKTVEMLKKQHDARRIVNKDFSIKNLFEISSKEINKKTKPYQQEDGTAIIPVIGIASKYVPKYDNGSNPGYHTTLYLKDGIITGAFSTAAHDLANFFFAAAGLDTEAEFNQLMFASGNVVNVRVSKIEFSGTNEKGETEARKTYNFEILDGEITGAERLGFAGTNLLIEAASEK